MDHGIQFFPGFSTSSVKNSRRYNKLPAALWVFIVLSASLIAMIQTKSTLVDYLRTPVYTTFKDFTVSHLPSPDVIICSTSRFNQRKLVKSGIKIELLRKILAKGFRDIAPDAGVGSLLQEYRAFKEANANISAEKLIVNNAIECSQIILYANSGGQALNICSNSTRTLTWQGNCIKIRNLPEQMETTINGGLKLILDPQPHTFLDPSQAGLEIGFLHSSMRHEDNLHPVSPGTVNTFKLSDRRRKYINSSLGNCISRKSFSNSICRDVTWAHVLNKLCGCVPYYVRSSKDFTLMEILFPEDEKEPENNRVCDPFEVAYCLSLNDNWNRGIRELGRFTEKCVQACDVNEYTAPVTVSYLNAEEYSQRYKINASNNSIAVLAYYPRMSYHLMESQFSMSWDELAAEVGGTWGLWIGISFLSMFQLAGASVKQLQQYYINMKQSINTCMQLAQYQTGQTYF